MGLDVAIILDMQYLPRPSGQMGQFLLDLAIESGASGEDHALLFLDEQTWKEAVRERGDELPPGQREAFYAEAKRFWRMLENMSNAAPNVMLYLNW